jgi:hypothetical protein
MPSPLDVRGVTSAQAAALLFDTYLEAQAGNDARAGDRELTRLEEGRVRELGVALLQVLEGKARSDFFDHTRKTLDDWGYARTEGTAPNGGSAERLRGAFVETYNDQGKHAVKVGPLDLGGITRGQHAAKLFDAYLRIQQGNEHVVGGNTGSLREQRLTPAEEARVKALGVALVNHLSGEDRDTYVYHARRSLGGYDLGQTDGTPMRIGPVNAPSIERLESAFDEAIKAAKQGSAGVSLRRRHPRE